MFLRSLVTVTLIFFGRLAALAQGGIFDPSFNPSDPGAGFGDGANSKVNCFLQQGDGKVVIGGQFTTFNGMAINRIARVSANGSLDALFNSGGTGANNSVQALVAQADGKILIGGFFTLFNGVTRSYIARLNSDGSLDPTFAPSPGANSVVNAIAVQPDGKILIAGDFTSYNGVARNRIARINTDGSLDASFNPGTGLDVQAYTVAVHPTGKILVGGLFNTVNGTAKPRLACLNSDGTLDATFNSGGAGIGGASSTNPVYQLLVQPDNKILVGGGFQTYNGAPRWALLRLKADGTVDSTFSGGTSPSNGVGPTSSNLLLTMSLQTDGKLVIGGSFGSYNGTSRNRIARLNSDGSLDASFNPGTGTASSDVASVFVQADGKILFGGVFTSYNGILRNRVGRCNADGSLDMNFNIAVGADAAVISTKVLADGKIYVGGQFSVFGGVRRGNVARLNSDGTVDATFTTGTGANGQVWTVLPLSSGKVLIGGSFTNYNGTACGSFARLNSDGTLDPTFNTGGTGVSGAVYRLGLQSDGKIIVAGGYTTINGTSKNYITRLNSDGTLDNTFNSGGTGASSFVFNVIVRGDDKIYISGAFTSYNGVLARYLARLNSDGTLDATFNSMAASNVYGMAEQADGKLLIGGLFTSYNGITRNRLARVTQDGSLDTAYASGTGANNSVWSVQELSGRTYVTGDFTTFHGANRGRIARVNSDGSLDTDFLSDPGTNGTVYTMTQQADGKFIFSGNFTTYNGNGRSRVARLLADVTRSISTGTLASAYCTGSAVSVSFTTTGSFNAANVFTAQLSDASGSFASPVSIGTLSGTGSGSISATIPTGTASGSGYRIRVVSNDPAVTGTDNGSNISITGQPAASIRYIGTPFCQSASSAAVTLSGSAGGIFSAAPAGLSINSANGLVDIASSTAGSYTVTYSIAAAAGCSAASATTSIRISSVAAVQPVASQALCAGVQTAPVTLTTAPAGAVVRWTNNNTSIGLAASGYRSIPAFTAVNNNPAPQTASLTATALKGLLYVVKSGNSNAVSVISRAHNEVAFNIPIGSAPDGIAVSSNGALIATADWGSDQVSIIDAATHTVLGTVTVGDEPYSLAFTPDASRLYVANLAAASVSVVDVASRSLIGTIAVGVSPVAILASRDGNRVYVANASSNSVSVISTATNTVTNSVTVTGFPADLAQSPDGSRVYVSRSNGLNLMAINTTTLTTSLVANVGADNTGVAVSPDGTRVYVGRYGSGQVYVVNTTNNTIETIISAGAGVLRLALSPDGTTLYTSNQSGNSVTVINTATNTVSNTISGITFPSGIAVSVDAVCSSPAQNFSITVEGARTATISYGADAYCNNVDTVAVSINGSTGGVFSASPAGLSIDTTSGRISPSQSTPGTYIISYFLASYNGTCAPHTAYDTVTIGMAASASISYEGSPYCSNAGTAAVTFSGTTGGTFTATPSGLALDAVTGNVNLAASAAGTYVVTYSISGSGCSFSTSDTITITTMPNAAISYSGSPFCAFAGSPAVLPTSSGTAGGTYSLSPGAPGFNTSNGLIDPARSVPGNYTVTYTVVASGGCAAFTTTASFVINAPTRTVLRYPGSPYCPGQGTALPILSGVEGGTYSAPAGLSIDASTGAVNSNSSQAGTYTVTYTLPAAPACGNATATAVVIISALPTIDPVPSQSLCSGSTLTAPVTGTASIHDWINSDTSIGLPAASSGMIWGWPVHNYTNAPITSTVTYLPRNMGNQAWVPLYNTNNVLLYDITSGNEWFRLPVGTTPLGTAVSPDGTRVYVTNNGSDNVSVINPNAFSVIATIPVGDGPYGVVVSPDGSRVYVANQFSNTVSVIDAATNSVIATIGVGGPNGIGINPAGTKLYVTSYDNRVYIINTATNTVTRSVTTGGAPEGIAFTPDGSRIYIANQFTNNVTVIDGYYDVPLATLPAGIQPEGVVMSKDGSKVYVVNQGSDNVYVYSTSSNQLIDSVHVGVYPEAASLTQDGSQLFVTNVGGKSISVINTATNQVVKTIPTTTNPYGLGNFISPVKCTGPAQSFTVTVYPAPSATIDYAGSPYCSNGGSATVTQTGTAGGHYSAVPAGLSLNSADGSVSLESSQPGTYVVTYTIDSTATCASFSVSDTIVINAAPVASIDYPASPYCSTAGSITPVRSGDAGGTFSAQPSGLSIDASTGIITAASSQPGTYVVTYSIAANGPCAAFSATDTVQISAAPQASFSYAGSPYCAGSGTASPTFAGSTGGAFSALPAGLSIDAATGAVNTGNSAAGSYIVSYAIPASGGCAAITATNSIVISTVPVVNQPGNVIACAGVATAAVPFSGNYSPAAYHWTISDTSLGLPASGYGPLPSFIPVNNGSTAINATVTVTPITGLVYGAESSTNKRIAVINRATRQVIQRFGTVQTGPSGIAITRDGRKLYTCNFETANVSVIDLATQTELTTIPASPSTYSMVLSPDETRLYVVGIANSNVTIINTQTNSVITRVTVGGSPRGITITPDGSKVFVACRNSNRVAVISTASNTQIASVPVAGGPYALAMNPDGSKVYVSCAVSSSLVSMAVSDYALTNVATVGTGSAGIAVSADGSRVYLAHGAPSGLRVIDPVAQTIVANIALPNFPVFVQLTPDGKEVYVNNQADSSISVVDLQTNTATRVASMAFPSGMAATQDASCSGTPKTFTITVNPASTATISYGASPYCSNAGVAEATFSGTPGGHWSASPAGLSLDSSNGSVLTFASQPGTYTVTYTVAAQNSCNAFTASTQITITAAPSATIAYSQPAYCASSGSIAVQLNGSTGGRFSSAAGLSLDTLSGAINTAASQAGSYVVTYTISQSGGCAPFTTSTSVTIHPAAVVSAVASKVYCADERSTPIVFGGGTAGTTYEWSNDNTSIGVAASGSGSIAPFTATNNGTTAAVANITVTPYLNGCSGSPVSFTLTVNPLPTVNAVSNQVACAGSNTAPIAFSSPVQGTSFSWTNSNTSIGLAAAGNGPVPAFTVVNGGNSPVSASIRVLASITSNGLTCNGRTTVLNITVNPTPNVANVSNQVVCNGTATSTVSFSGTVPGTIYKWTNSNPSIGLAASGTGDIPSFVGTNATASVQTATITVTPQFFGGTLCSGNAVSFTISVQPDLAGSTSFSYSGSPYCNNAGIIAASFTGISGGRFTASPAGLSIDSLTGAVNSNLSQTGSYTVSYTIGGMGGNCNQVSSTSISIIAPTSASIAYAASPYCATGTAAAQRSGTPGGLFTASPAGLSIDSASGTINLAASQPGNYVVTYTVTAAGSGCSTVQATASITVNPVPSVSPVSNQVLCNGSNSTPITFSGPVAGTTYSWSNNNTSVGVGATGVNSVPAFTASNNTGTAQQALIRVTPTSSNGAGVCTGPSSIVMIQVNPVATVNPVSGQTVCAGTGTQAISFSGSIAGSSFKWTNSNPAIGLAASGTGDIPSFAAQNSTAGPISATITVTPQFTGGGLACNGTAVSFTITVQPFTAGTSISYPSPLCAAAASAAPTISGTTGGRFSSSAGLAIDSVSGVISPVLSAPGTYVVSYLVANGGACPQFASTSVTIVATPSASISYGASPYCQSGTANVLRTGTTGGIYSASPAGLSINSGSGAIALAGSTAGTYTVTYTVNAGSGCAPFSTSTTVTIAATPTVNPVSNQVWCNGNSTNAVSFTGTAPGTVYNWTNSTPSIGLAASGTGNIASFVAVNNGTTQARATISVTPSLSNGASNCPGKTVTFTIAVNPTPTVSTVANQVVCKGSATTQVNLTGPVAGSTYNWTNNNSTVGLAANGTNTVPSFIALNPTANPIAATITVTPNYLNGVRCFGPAITYTYTINNCSPRLITKGAAQQPVEEGELSTQVKVGPNPTPTGLLYIYYTGDATRRLSYQVTDAQGRMLRSAPLQGSRTEVDLRGYSAGSYLLQVRDPKTGASVQQVILRP